MAQSGSSEEIVADYVRYARAALPAYGYPSDTSLRILSLSENATFLVEHETPVVFRVHRPGYHSVQAVRSELAWMAAIRTETTVNTPELVPTSAGEPLVEVELDGETRVVDAVSFISGSMAEDDPDLVGFDELGRITAWLHGHVEQWQVPDEFERFVWDEETILGDNARWGDWRLAPGLDVDDTGVIAEAVDVVRARLEHFGKSSQRFGLIHADLRLANVMVSTDGSGAPSLTVIDFDDCGWSWFLADLAAVLSFIEETPAAEHIITHWLIGYLSVRELSDDELAMIPTFVMLRRIMLTAWIGSHPNADAAQELAAGFAPGTARLARRYLFDQSWLREAIRAGSSLQHDLAKE